MRAPSLFRATFARIASFNFALMLAAIGLLLVLTTFAFLAGGLSVIKRSGLEVVVIGLDVLVFGLLALVVLSRVSRMLSERRRGLAGARLHVRLITYFGIVSVVPTVLVGILAALFFHFGIQIWFTARVNTAVQEAQDVAAGYLQEHNANIRADAQSIADDLIGAENRTPLGSEHDFLHDPDALSDALDREAVAHGLTEAVVFDPGQHDRPVVIARGGVLSSADIPQNPLPPPQAIAMARTSQIAIFGGADQTKVRAVVPLGEDQQLMLLITRAVDPQILAHVQKTNAVVAEYARLNANRFKMQVNFAVIFAILALLVMTLGMLTGLVLAKQIANPLGLLILASRRISSGDLDVRVPVSLREARTDDEVRSLSRAFNAMTDQLSSQRAELVRASAQIDERRRFTEAVLSGVSAGVIGLDAETVIELPNRAASSLLHRDIEAHIGRRLADIVPEFAGLLEAMQNRPQDALTREIRIETEKQPLGDGPGTSSGRILQVRIVAELRDGDAAGYVVTFDDITELVSAQRKAAWADVARRIAHEIKNPLTPIQLSAERLKRRFLREIASDPETFSTCVDTIVRHVGDIGRMVDEFSSFARMPQPVFRDEDLSRLVRESLVLPRHAHPEIVFETSGVPEAGPILLCDRRLITQALTNLLQNAADAIAMIAKPTDDPQNPHGLIRVSLTTSAQRCAIAVEDDGVGLPAGDRHRLTEPYVTHKAKGTGLGLAIVKKIMEDHGGTISLSDRPQGRGTLTVLTLPMNEHDRDHHGA